MQTDWTPEHLQADPSVPRKQPEDAGGQMELSGGAGFELSTPRGAARLEIRREASRKSGRHGQPQSQEKSGCDDAAEQLGISVYRAGEITSGPELKDARPVWGWISSTYGEKQPAHLVVAHCVGTTPLRLVSSWILGIEKVPGLDLDWRPPGEPGCVLESLRCADVSWDPDLQSRKRGR